MKKLLYLFTLLLTFSVYSQNHVDIVNIAWDEGFQNAYGTEGQTGRFTEWNADLTVPIVLSEKIALLSGITSEGINLAFTESSNDDIQVYGLGMKIGLNIKHSDKWSGTYLSIPKLSSDQLRFSSDNFQVGWIGLMQRSFTPYKNVKFGFYTNSELFGPFLVPLIGYYNKTDKWELNIMAPLAAQIEYLVSNQVKAGVHFKGIIKSYELNEQVGYLTKANNEVSLATSVQLGKLVWMTNFGTTIGRRIRIYEDEERMDFAMSALKFGDNREQLNEDLQDGLFIKTSLILRFSTL